MQKKSDKLFQWNEPVYDLKTLVSVGALGVLGGLSVGVLAGRCTEARYQVTAALSASSSPSAASKPLAPRHKTVALDDLNPGEKERLDHDYVSDHLRELDLSPSERERYFNDHGIGNMLRYAAEGNLSVDPGLYVKYLQDKVTPREINEILARQCDPTTYRASVSKCLTLVPISDANELKRAGIAIGWTKEKMGDSEIDRGEIKQDFEYLQKFPPNPALRGKPVTVCLANFNKTLHIDCARKLFEDQGHRLADLNETVSYLRIAKDFPAATFMNASWTSDAGVVETLYFGREGSPWTLVHSDSLVPDNCKLAVVQSK